MPDFTYTLPDNFNSRIGQLLKQECCNIALAETFSKCKYEYEDVGLAYYAGVKGDVWNKKALDFIVEGKEKDISLLKSNQSALKNSIAKALKPAETGFVLRNITYLFIDEDDVLPSSDEKRLNADIKAAESVLADLLQVGERLCSNATYNGNSSENSINDFFRDTLSLMGYNEVKDQTRHGVSSSGQDAGEVDILITKEGKEIAIFEGLKLSSVNTSYIDNHITKAIINYNALGTATFVVAYVNIANYESFWNKYVEHLQDIDYQLTIKRGFEILTTPNAATRIASVILSREGFDFPVYYLTFRLSK